MAGQAPNRSSPSYKEHQDSSVRLEGQTGRLIHDHDCREWDARMLANRRAGFGIGIADAQDHAQYPQQHSAYQHRSLSRLSAPQLRAVSQASR
jgi:hypothetical protein